MDKMTFRFDDVCCNADMTLVNNMTDYLLAKFDCQVIWAISPLVHTGEGETQRVFPKMWNAFSDYKVHYGLDSMCGMAIRDDIISASHGLIHVDHRLLTKEAQEMSILLSASLTKAAVFVPPFNKWNKDTEDICFDNDIKLIKFEDGWKSMEFNKFNEDQQLWYLHAREWTLESFKAWFKC